MNSWRLSPAGLARDQHQRQIGDQRDRREIGRRIVGRVLVERLVLRVGADVAEHELVAVGRRLGDARRAGHAAGAADVLDDHLLAEQLGQARREMRPTTSSGRRPRTAPPW